MVISERLDWMVRATSKQSLLEPRVETDLVIDRMTVQSSQVSKKSRCWYRYGQPGARVSLWTSRMTKLGSLDSACRECRVRPKLLWDFFFVVSLPSPNNRHLMRTKDTAAFAHARHPAASTQAFLGQHSAFDRTVRLQHPNTPTHRTPLHDDFTSNDNC